MAIYPSLVHGLGYWIEETYSGSCAVFRVRGNPNPEIVKIAMDDSKESPGFSYFDHVITDSDALERASGVPGIPRKINFIHSSVGRVYSSADEHLKSKKLGVLVREFIPGQMLSKGDVLTNSDKQKLYSSVRSLHELGMAHLDLFNPANHKPSNILMNSFPHIIDLGFVRFRERIGNDYFEDYRTQDLKSLDSLFSSCS